MQSLKTDSHVNTLNARLSRAFLLNKTSIVDMSHFSLCNFQQTLRIFNSETQPFPETGGVADTGGITADSSPTPAPAVLLEMLSPDTECRLGVSPLGFRH